MTVRVLPIILLSLLCAGCVSFLSEGRLCSASEVPRLKYRVDEVSLKYGCDFLRQQSLGETGMPASAFNHFRPDVFGAGEGRIPISVRVELLDEVMLEHDLRWVSLLTLTLVPRRETWRAKHKVIVMLAGDERLAENGEIELRNALSVSAFTPSGLIFTPARTPSFGISEITREWTMEGGWTANPERREKIRTVFERTIVEEVAGVLGKMERGRGL